MKTLKEVYEREIDFTKELANDLVSLNKINNLVGLPSVVSAQDQYPIPGGSIDVVAWTTKNEVIIYEHQDKGDRADQRHVSKTVLYAHQMSILGNKVIGGILLCGAVDNHYMKQFADERKEFKRRKNKGHKNLHIVKSSWTDSKIYKPELFDNTNIIKIKGTTLNYFEDFHKVYSADWKIKREDKYKKSGAILWIYPPMLEPKYETYIWATVRNMRIGMHCYIPTDYDKVFLQKILPNGWSYKNKSDGRATVTILLDKNSTQTRWANEMEKLRRNIRRNKQCK